MSNHKHRTVEWVLRGVELVTVFVAMTWALLWAATRRSHRRRLEGSAFAAAGLGRALDLDDPDGGASMERSRRRRHID